MLALAEEGFHRGNRAGRVIGLLLTAACLGFVTQRLVRHADELPSVTWGWRPLLAVLGASGVVVVIAAIHAFAWKALMRSVSPRMTWRQSFVICGRSQFAKYLPGSVFQYFQQVGLTRRDGVQLEAAAAVTIADASLVALAAGLVAVPVVGRLGAAFGHRLPWVLIVVLCAGAAAAGAVAISRRARESMSVVRRTLAPRSMACALAVDVSLFLFPGLALSILLHGIWPGAASVHWYDFVPSFAAAFLVGYVFPGAPGGLGAREAALYAMYQGILGSAVAAGLFLVARVAFVAGDVLTFTIAVALEHRGADRSSTDAS
jgi:uncharacterized membrane protein YbhN (UPF0104 family)